MSDSQQYEGETISSDGVTVIKRFEEEEFPVPAIAFEIRSERAETVTITLVDDVPEGVAVDDLGFHPEYGSEYWTIEEERITFEREIEAGSEYTTVYGIRATGTDDVEQFLGEPRLERVDPPLDGDPGVIDDGTDVVRDIISGESDSVPGLDDEEGSDVEPLDLTDPTTATTEREATTDDAATGDDTADEGQSAATAAAGQSLTAALAAELREGNVSERDVELLREALDVAGGGSGSTDARIKRLQTEVADLLAYADAMEAFLDENGTGDEMIEEFRERLESFESELAEMESLAERHEESVSSLEETVESVQSSMDGLESEVESAVAEVESADERLDEVEDEIEGVNDDVRSVSSDVDDLEERIDDVDVSELEAQLSTLESDIEELKEWREQLSSVIGG